MKKIPRNNSTLKNFLSLTFNESLLTLKNRIIENYHLLDKNLFYNSTFCNNQTLFTLSLPSFLKPIKDREESDIIFISLYLSKIQKLEQLIKSNVPIHGDDVNQKKKAQEEFYKLLTYVSINVSYIKFQSNRLLMRYGEEGENFYIILNGIVSIIIPIKKTIEISLCEYFRYISLLIIYKEKELLHNVVKDNKKTKINLDMPGFDYFFNKYEKNFLSAIKNAYLKYKENLENNKPKKICSPEKINNNKNNKKIAHRYSLNIKTEEETNLQKLKEFLSMYLTKDELKYYLNTLNDPSFEKVEYNDHVLLTSENYIKRISNYSIVDNPFIANKIKKTERQGIRANIKHPLTIYEYKKVTELTSGEMFGDIALSSTTSNKRTATIITANECHFASLFKNIYKKSIQDARETHKNNVIDYICNTNIFYGFPRFILSKKFFNNFVFKNTKKNQLILKNKETNPNIILIKEGTYEILYNGSIHDIFKLINIYYKNLTSIYSTDVNIDLTKKVQKMLSQEKKIERILGEENFKVKEYKLLLINSPSVFGLRETEEKIIDLNKCYYKSFYDIKCISLTGEYIGMDKNIFYPKIYGTEFTVQESTKNITRHFLEKVIYRLLNIRYGKIYNFFVVNDLLNNDENNKNIELNKELNNNSHNLLFEKINSLVDNCDENNLVIDKVEKYLQNYFNSQKTELFKKQHEFKIFNKKFQKHKMKKIIDEKNNINRRNSNTSLQKISSMISYKTKLKLNTKGKKLFLNKNNNNNSVRSNKILHSFKKINFSNFSVSKQKRISHSSLNTQNSIKKKTRPKSSINLRNNTQNSFNNSSGLIVNKYSIMSYPLKTRENKKNNNKKFSQKNFDYFSQTNYSSFLNENDDYYDYNTKNRSSFINYRNNYVLNITRMIFSKYKLIKKRKRCKSAHY